MVVLLALTANLIAADPNRQDLAVALRPPTWFGGEATAGVLGTDNLGRDIFSRVAHGARVSLLIGVLAVAVAGAIGTLLGLISGFQGGWLGALVMRLADFQLSVPFLILALAIVAAIGPSLLNLIVVLGITGWVPYARVVRSEVLSLREREFVLAARAVGASSWRIMLVHLRPNITASVIVLASLEVARMILSEASLSFLGLGVPPTTPSWGGMVADGRNYLESAWWLATIPGLAIAFTVLGVNLLGDRLRDVLDPHLRRS
jgi:peptide/nickel transport system permease protein